MSQVPNQMEAEAETTRRNDQHYNHFDPDSHFPHKMTACKGLSMGGCLHTRSYSESFTISVSGTGAISYIPRQIENLPKF